MVSIEVLITHLSKAYANEGICVYALGWQIKTIAFLDASMILYVMFEARNFIALCHFRTASCYTIVESRFPMIVFREYVRMAEQSLASPDGFD
jgi:hypothetical protein